MSEPENLFWELLLPHLGFPNPVAPERVGDKIGREEAKQAFEAAVKAMNRRAANDFQKHYPLEEWEMFDAIPQPSSPMPHPPQRSPEPTPGSKMDQVIEKWAKILKGKKDPTPAPPPQGKQAQVDKIIALVEKNQKELGEEGIEMPSYMQFRGPGAFRMDGYLRDCTPAIVQSLTGMLKDHELSPVEFMSIDAVVNQNASQVVRKVKAMIEQAGHEPQYYLSSFYKVRDPIHGGFVNVCEYKPIPVK